MKAFFTAEPQSAQGIFILCLPLRRGPAQYARISNPLTILFGRYPANIKNNPPKGEEFLMRYRLKTARDAFARRAEQKVKSAAADSAIFATRAKRAVKPCFNNNELMSKPCHKNNPNLLLSIILPY